MDNLTPDQLNFILHAITKHIDTVHLQNNQLAMIIASDAGMPAPVRNHVELGWATHEAVSKILEAKTRKGAKTK